MYFTFRYAKLAKEESGTSRHYANGSSLNSQNSCFIPPTIVTNLPKGARCLREEIFGPFLCISKFSTELEAIELANDVKYGLCLRFTNLARFNFCMRNQISRDL